MRGKWLRVTLSLLLAMGLMQCREAAPEGEQGTAPASDADRYRQSWGKNYSDTSCSEWHQQMTSAQRFAAAADMLVGARGVDGGEGLPPDSLISQFEGDIGEACEAGNVLPLNEVAVGIYVIGKQTYGP